MYEMIHNVPEYAKNYPYLVVNLVEGEFQFWGAYKTLTKASEVASTICTYVIFKNETWGV